MQRTQISEQFALELYRGEHDVENDVLVACLMGLDFVFDPALHATYGDIAADELPTGFGYTQKDKTVGNVSVSVSSGIITMHCDSPVWTPTAEIIGPTSALCIINTTHLNETVVACITFGGNFISLFGGTPLSVGLGNGVVRSEIVSSNLTDMATAGETEMSAILARLVSEESYGEADFMDWVFVETGKYGWL